MIERLEVVPGPGTVVRYGGIAAWTGGSASASLIGFLAESARNLASSPVGGDQVADHLEGVLSRRDPEPHVAFVVVGPGRDGWAVLLHGPVQVWDGMRWTAPAPEVGWLRASVSPRPTLAVSSIGAPVAAPAPDAVGDLEAGVVPGGGFILVPATRSPAPSGPYAARDPEEQIPEEQIPEEQTAVLPLEGSGPPTEILPISEAAPPAVEPEPELPAVEPEPELPPERDPELPPERELPTPDVPTPARRPTPPGVIDLASGETLSRVVAYPPLPPVGDPPSPVPGAPVVAGVPCPAGHINRPGMTACGRCGRTVDAGPGHRVTGTRPALGCLITDEGVVYRLDTGYLVGSDPERDPTVRSRLARPLRLGGPDVASSHAEIRLQDWDVVVGDRASEGGTHVFVPGGVGWERLRAYEPRVLPAGAHLAFGQRVVTFVTPWVGPRSATRDTPDPQDTAERY